MNFKSFKASYAARLQRGTALFVGLIFLLILSLLSISVMSASLMQERLAGSHRNEALAAAGAESALRQGEQAAWNEHLNNCGIALPTGSVFNKNNSAAARAYRNNPLWVVSGNSYNKINYVGIAREPGSSVLARQPTYLIEDLGQATEDREPTVGGCNFKDVLVFFRINARSTGSDTEVVRTLQSTMAVTR